MIKFSALWLIPFVHVTVFLAWTKFCAWETEYNNERITADGARNSLKGRFHLGRTLLRIAVALPLATLGAAIFWGHNAAMLACVGALLCAFGGYFLPKFNTDLNIARGKSPTYVSTSSTTALLDRSMVWLCKLLHGDDYLLLDLDSTYRLVMGAAVVFGLLSYAGLMWVAVLLK